MIKFFKRIRQQLLSENRLGKYLLYAIGEIVLVVIGILIAIQVSNWNDRRKELLAIEQLIDKYEDDLRLTIRNANHDLGNSMWADSLFRRVLSNSVSKADYQDNPRFEQLSTWRFTLNPSLNNRNKLLEIEEALPAKYEGTISEKFRFDFMIGREQDAMNLLRESANRNADYFNMNYTWARKSDSLSKDAAYDYFLTDEGYKSRLFTHWNKAMNYTRLIGIIRSVSFNELIKLKMIREDCEAVDLKETLEDLDQRAFKKFESGAPTNSDTLINIQQFPVIVNWTEDTLDLKLYTQYGLLVQDREIDPKEVTGVGEDISTEHQIMGHDAYYLRVFKVYKDDVLLNEYMEVPNGYLIIE
jgi:hypothetical protein